MEQNIVEPPKFVQAHKRDAAKKRKKTIKIKQKSKKGVTEKITKSRPNENVSDENDSEPEERILPNNWSRYEMPDDQDTKENDAANYESLLQPICSDAFFKLKSEQNWDNDIKSQTKLSKYFTLNLKLLNAGISCLPFTKRLDIDESQFSTADLENVNKTAKANTQKYNKYIERLPNSKTKCIKNENTERVQLDTTAETIIKILTDNNEKERIVETIIKEDTETNLEKTIESEDDLDELLNLKTSKCMVETEEIIAEDPLLEAKVEVKKITTATVDLEEWLDDILDD